ncbi:Flagellar motor rotation protein MotB [Marinobacter nitratireducens]|uniref:Flagellar motor rotation protein MotB n=1 Tax=Marinobacter nitratireducens TaxID=1137280 RepID=A0A072MZE6_9GAMM|nr:flagellar motor protein MotB [Marinobacter nitratireducens]KEF30073.1 Flagellar motor rotation protein MotB [Marinobacter nitratireducens]
MDELPEEEKPGIPAWVVTFADLMSLLMCFFVLLLSFSEIDAQKFKQIAGELSKAFGVQRDVPALEIPKGTSPIFDKFSPAPPEPTVINQVKQTTTTEAPELETLKSPTEKAVEAAMQEKMDENAQEIMAVLDEAIKEGRVNVAQDQRRIVIRVEEKGSFPSGSAQLTWEFEGLLLEMADVLADMPGKLTIEGHTDDVPIRTKRFYSNWDLSAARAAAVANVLLHTGEIEPTRLAVKGLADTEPRVANDSSANRAKNRRVEIIIDLSGPLEEQEIELREIIESESKSQDAVIDIESGNAPENQISW